ncbi:hypothetical protein DRW41_03725 [Neobacillus piezotolerans]|uniref:Uncharacterized protein n=1 Tax=Neobacillus piezotolerans TaxID=2259171 RepID=A0A3D8GW42_9BACI|nr:hypothetical protein [Neobacillus piezotolerans]RDU38680.1 hypothetical protein DRW41_03725 [Neobacillus piezotolerans]
MNIQLQDLTVTIMGTSRYNGGRYDMARVETLLVTTEPIPTEMSWYVPAGVSIPNEVLALFNATGLKMQPTLEENVLAGTDDIREQAQQGELQEVQMDAAKFLMRAVLKKTILVPLPDSPNTYHLSYEHKVYPVKDNPSAFDFRITLPFDGLILNPSGGRVQVSVLCPIGAQIDPNETLGIDDHGQEIAEQVVHLANTNRFAVNFGYQIDPEFIIRYQY